MAVNKIEDFGDDIGGARKELAAFRKNGGFTAEQVSSWTDYEREKHIVKKTLFPAPDYQKLVDEQGYSREAAFFIKKVLDALPSKPCITNALRYGSTDEEKRESIRNAQDTYITIINIIKENLMDVKSLTDAANFKNNINQSLQDNDISLMRSFDRTAITKFNRAASAVSSGWNLSKFMSELDKKAFLYSADEEKLRHFSIQRYDGENVKVDKGESYNGTPYERLAIRTARGTSYFYDNAERFMDADNWKADTYFIRFSGKNHGAILENNFATKEEAQAFAIAYLDNERAKQAEMASEDKANTRKTRLVPPQLQHIKRIGEDYLEGKNVTGEMMLGTFGLVCGKFGNYENQNDRQTNLNMSYEAFKDLAKALNIADEDISLGHKLSMFYGADGRGNALAHFEPARNVINITKLRGAGSLGHEFGHALDHVIALYNGRSEHFETDVWHGDLKGVMDAIRFNPDGHGNTTYYTDAACIDKMHSKCDKGYWRSGVELFARAFATYLQDKIEPNKCDYLCGHAEFPPVTYTNPRTQESRLVYTYPRGEERERINAEFDKLIEKLKEKGMLHERPQEKEHALIEQQDGINVTAEATENILVSASENKDDVALSGRIEKYNLNIDFSEINSIEIEKRTEVYLGGMDDNGHERKDNYQETTETISLYASSDKSSLLIYDEERELFDYPIDISDALEKITEYLDLSAIDSDVHVFVKSNDGDYKLLTSVSEDKQQIETKTTETAKVQDVEASMQSIQTEILQNAKEAIDRIINQYEAAFTKEKEATKVEEAPQKPQTNETVYEQYVQMSLDDYQTAPVEPVKATLIGFSEINAETAVGMVESGDFEVYDKNNALVTDIADIVNETDTYKARESDVEQYVERETIALAIDDISEAYRFMPQEVGEPYHLDLMRYPDYYEWDSFKVGKNVYQNVMIALQEGNFGVLNEYLTEVCNSDRNSEYAKKASEVKDMLECYEVNRAFLEKCNATALDNREEGEYNSHKGFDPSQITSITKSKNEAEGYTVNGISGIPPEAANGRYIAYVDFGDGDKWFSNAGDNKRALNIDDTLDDGMTCIVIDNPIYKATEVQLDKLISNEEHQKTRKPKQIERD